MNYANNAFSVLNGAISNVATAITLATGTGSRFPSSDFRVTLIGYDGLGNENAWEICHCTSRSGDVLTVTRAQEGTTAVAWANATRIENRLTAGSISGGIAYTRKTAAYTLGDKEGIIADTTGGSFIVKLPASPSAGIQCFIADGADWSVNNLTVDPQGATIESLAAGETVVFNIGGLSAQFLHDGTKWNMHVTAAVVSGGNVVTTSATQTLINKTIGSDLVFSGNGLRIRGDFDNPTLANRLMFQTSTNNGITDINVIPSGSGTESYVTLSNSSDPANASRLQAFIKAAEATIESTKLGLGSYLPIGIWTSGLKRMVIDIAGLVGIGKTPVAGRGLLQVNGGIEATDMNGGQLAGLRNKIINGKMEISQRGTSFASPLNYTYTLDRFLWNFVGSGAVTISQQTDAPASSEFRNSLRVAVTSNDAAIASGDVYAVGHTIEGFNVSDLIGRTFVLSFWVRSSKAGTHCVALGNSAADRSYVSEYTVNAADTWEKKTITISGGLISAGSWDFTNGLGILLRFALAAGASFQTTANAWQTGNFLATANQVNCLDTIGNIFAITGVQLEVGSVATPFEHRPYGLELALCQRYYYRIGQNQSQGIVGVGIAFASTGGGAQIQFPVQMRLTPSSLDQSGTATDYQVFSSTGTFINCSVVPAYNAATTPKAAWVNFTVASGLTAGNALVPTFQNNNAYLGWSAEL